MTGNLLHFFVDDALTLTVSDPTYTTGGFGLVVFNSFEADVGKMVVTALPANP